MPAYDTNNIFAKILRGEFPCHKVYEDDHVLAFLDIMPRVSGHTLVIPKAPARNILDITPEDYAHVARGAHRIAAAAMTAFKADGITVQQFNEAAGGQVVFHLHMHVMPRHDGVALLPPASRKEDVKVLEDNATKLIAALKGGYRHSGARDIPIESHRMTVLAAGDAHSVSKSPGCGCASGVNSQRSGLMSRSGVSSRQSRPRTSTTLPSMPTSLTIEVPIGLGRTGERSENAPRVLPLSFGLCSTRSRRDWCSQ